VKDAIKAIVALGAGCFLIKLDVEAAYRQVPVRREDWPLLGFKWLDKWYYERCLPFGLKSSCALWELYAAALHHFFRELGVPVVIHYIDDFLFVVKCEQHARSLLESVLALCQRLGVPMAADKTEGPTTALTFLGIRLDTVAMRASLPPEKLLSLRLLLSEWRSKSSATAKECKSLAGLLNFAATVVRPGRFYMRRIWAHIARCDAREDHQRYANLALSKGILADVAWWHEFIEQWNGVSFLYDQEWQAAEKLQLFTDSCDTGYGCVCGDDWFAGRWTPQQLAIAERQKRISMPFLELHALVSAAATFGHRWARKKILFRCDCQPVVQAIAKGNSRAKESMSLLRHLAFLAAKHNFDFQCQHVEGARNVAADLLSRLGDCPQFRAERPQAAPQPTAIAAVPLPSPDEE
jgi:hypothetical protein